MKKLIAVAVATLTAVAVLATPSTAGAGDWTGKLKVGASPIVVLQGEAYEWTVKWAFPGRKADRVEFCVVLMNDEYGDTEPACYEYILQEHGWAKKNRRGWSLLMFVEFDATYCDVYLPGDRLGMYAVAYDDDKRRLPDIAFMSASIPIRCTSSDITS